MLALAGGTGAAASYWMLDHVRARRPLPLSHARRQLADRPRHPVLCRGWLPRPRTGRGTIKSTLPDAHTDFIFAVVAEEYGVVACLALLALFAFLSCRALLSARREADAATRLAVQGLAPFGLQALINMAVNVGLVPAKGMTLPFISAGGSSTLAVAITLGMVLALTQRRPDPARLKKPRLIATLGGPEIKGTPGP